MHTDKFEIAREQLLYVQIKCSTPSPPVHRATDGVTAKLGTRRVTPRTVTKHRLARGLGGKTAVQYYAYWGPTCEQDEELRNAVWKLRG